LAARRIAPALEWVGRTQPGAQRVDGSLPDRRSIARRVSAPPGGHFHVTANGQN